MAFENLSLDEMRRRFLERVISGGSTSGDLTNTELRASPVAVSITGTALGTTAANRPTASPAGPNRIGLDVNPLGVPTKVGDGKFFVSGAAVALGGVGSTDRATFRLRNPAGSGKALYITGVTIYSTVAQQVTYHEDGTFTASGTSTSMNVNRSSAVAAVGVVDFGVGTLTGGTNYSNQSRVGPTNPLDLNFPPLVLPPSKSLIVRGTDSSAQTFTVNAYWFEE